MKVTLALCLVTLAAAAQDTQPPVISLDLTAIRSAVKYSPTATHIGVGCAKAAGAHNKYCRAVSGSITDHTALKPGYSYVTRYSRTCKAGCTLTDCPLPNAHAYDHQQGTLPVKRVIRLLNDDGEKCVRSKDNDYCIKQFVDYAERSEYAIEFDATDDSQNQAEKLVFTLILDDVEAPSVTPDPELPGIISSGLESCNLDNPGQDQDVNPAYWIMPSNALANDNIDGDVKGQLVIKITDPTGITTQATQDDNKINGKDDATLGLHINTHKLGSWKIQYIATDNAGMFGLGGKSNVNKGYEKTIIVRDSMKPVIYCKSESCALEPGKVNEVIRKRNVVNTEITADSVEVCCHECEKQQYARAVGSRKDLHAPACGFFTYDKTNKKCYLLSAALDPKADGVIEQADDWAFGYPIQCRVQNNHECGTTFTDPGARCMDLRDSFDVGSNTWSDLLLKPDTSILSQPISTKQIGLQTVQYTCTDRQGLKADTKTRYINVRDTQKPTIALSDGHTVEVSATVTPGHVIKGYENGFTCTDANACDANPKTTFTWHLETCEGAELKDNEGNPNGLVQDGTWAYSNKKGTYAIKYTCTDAAGLSSTTCRIVVNQDKTAPVIKLNDAENGDIIKVPAAATGSFEDKGATCFDNVDGQINDNVVVTGSNIKLNRPGTYTIKYNCADSALISAKELTKTVIVEDSVCPRCVVNGAQVMKVEANYPYTEEGATCTDAIGYVDSNNVVQTTLAAEAVGAVNVRVTGTYTITYKAKDGVGNYNDGSAGELDLGGGKTTCTGGNKVDDITVYQREVKVEDTLKPVISIDYNNIPIHVGDSSDTGHNGVTNLAGDAEHNPYLVAGQLEGTVKTMTATYNNLMAEKSTTTNVWFVAALASAAAGVALMAIQRRAPVATSVPV